MKYFPFLNYFYLWLFHGQKSFWRMIITASLNTIKGWLKKFKNSLFPHLLFSLYLFSFFSRKLKLPATWRILEALWEKDGFVYVALYRVAQKECNVIFKIWYFFDLIDLWNIDKLKNHGVPYCWQSLRIENRDNGNKRDYSLRNIWRREVIFYFFCCSKDPDIAALK